jgi:cyclic-di-AMP phosphodiesterase PgpH
MSLPDKLDPAAAGRETSADDVHQQELAQLRLEEQASGANGKAARWLVDRPWMVLSGLVIVLLGLGLSVLNVAMARRVLVSPGQIAMTTYIAQNTTSLAAPTKAAQTTSGDPALHERLSRMERVLENLSQKMTPPAAEPTSQPASITSVPSPPITPLATLDADTPPVIYRRGDVLSLEQVRMVRADIEAQQDRAQPHEFLLEIAAISAGSILIALAVGGYIATFAPGLMRRPRRLAALALLFAGALVLVCGLTIADGRLAIPAAIVLPMLTATLLVVAYERRTALAIGSLLGLACAWTLRLPIELAILPIAGVGVMVWRLGSVRKRSTLVKSGLTAGVVVAVLAIVLLPLRVPLSEPAIIQILQIALASGIGSLIVGFVVLGLLPTIERVFGVVTALSLVELRDPDSPLLQQLRQRAPGTYSHSLNVASLAEQAARAVGADHLLTYVGALYHDVGKLNRPEFFVENQQGGPSRHDRMSPALSTLMIVSHVADGLQLAREHRLPEPLHHFIEAHHGSTMVEYFFRRAVAQHTQKLQQNLESDEPIASEFRYPGPKPRSKEVACVMICDAAESAARVLPDQSPQRLEHLVRSLIDKRLTEGQFDDCALTMRDLSIITQTVARTLASVHHRRVAYPEPPRSDPQAKLTPVITPGLQTAPAVLQAAPPSRSTQ